MPRLLIPTGCWKVDADTDSTNDQGSIRLSGHAFSDMSKLEQRVQTILLTQDQAHMLISTLNAALRELELQRVAAVARAAEGEGLVSHWDYP
ncbi:MAG: hypothetical protein WCA85_02765 [Paraburkholderia sp.]|uniref:hypothetical protein n=1 Tax=Paraburkholderia sp. TaxID=1926495 RepID=UPI003C67515F